MKQVQANRLIFLGILLFLLGLIIGLFVQNMANPRMALSAHLEGIMNGMFLMLVGVIWNRILLSEKLLKISFWLLIYSTFANITAVLISALTGAGKMMPIAGGKEGAPTAEGIINFLLISLSLGVIFVCVMLLSGYYRYMKQGGDR